MHLSSGSRPNPHCLRARYRGESLKGVRPVTSMFRDMCMYLVLRYCGTAVLLLSVSMSRRRFGQSTGHALTCYSAKEGSVFCSLEPAYAPSVSSKDEGNIPRFNGRLAVSIRIVAQQAPAPVMEVPSAFSWKPAVLVYLVPLIGGNYKPQLDSLLCDHFTELVLGPSNDVQSRQSKCHRNTGTLDYL